MSNTTIINDISPAERKWLDFATPIIKESALVTMVKKFIAFFGVEPSMCEMLYSMITDKMDADLATSFKGKHLLWGLYSLRVYGSEIQMSAVCNCSPATF